MTTHLLDANVLIALTVSEHEHHAAATTWAGRAGRLAVCPVVEGALVRFLVRMGIPGDAAAAGVRQIRGVSGCEFWPDSLSYADADLSQVRGHRQVTDAYLVRLAGHHGGVLATLDRGLAATYGGQTVLVTEG